MGDKKVEDLTFLTYMHSFGQINCKVSFAIYFSTQGLLRRVFLLPDNQPDVHIKVEKWWCIKFVNAKDVRI